MDKVKVRNKKTGAIKLVKRSLAADYVGTGNFVLVEEQPVKKKTVVEE